MKHLLGFICLLSVTIGNSQTLFTYGKDKVTAEEFLRAYKKSQNTADPVLMKDYLDLFIASKLKVKEARQRRYDTLPQIVAELTQLRSQIAPAYLNDEEGLDRMVTEAFTRMQKDIRIAHIFIAVKPDSIAAQQKLSAVTQALAKGESFSAVASRYSDDPAATTNGGDLGFITVFSLPYELENLAWETPVGQVSKTYRSTGGYHIFKNLEERKAFGKMKAAQILLAFPPDASEAIRDATKSKADSIYAVLMKGGDFARLAEIYSNDVVSAASGGMIPEFGVGEYDPVFEKNVFALTTDNSIIGPFMTLHGWHIVKRISRTPPPATLDDITRQSLRDKIENNDRITALRNATMQKVAKLVPHKISAFTSGHLWTFSDSVFNNLSPKGTKSMNKKTVLFKTSKEKTYVSDWIEYAQVNRFKRDGSGLRPLPELWQEYLLHKSFEYYRNHLEDYNSAFKSQVDEFKEGNLFFEIMQREVWEKAQNDTIALKNYYNKNKARYNWKPSADAVIFFAADPETANEAREALLKNRNWKEVARDFANRVVTDSSRIEMDQIPNGANVRLAANTVTNPVTNSTDNSTSFAFIIRTYDKPEPRSFADAKGLVINDYQAELDKAWVAKLKKKYPVVINQKVWADLQSKHTPARTETIRSGGR